MRSMFLLATVAIGLGACRADRDAAEQVDMRPDPRIEAAPAYPTPPGEVPIGLQPDTAPGVGQGTLPADTARPTGAGVPGALPARP